MSKLKKALINCVTQAQNVRFKGSVVPPTNPREFWHLAQAYPLLPGRGSPAGEAASSGAVFSDDRLSLRCLADAGWHNACHRAQGCPVRSVSTRGQMPSRKMAPLLAAAGPRQRGESGTSTPRTGT